MSGKILTMINFKGGVGKTTISVNLAGCLVKEHNKRVLLIDFDPQSNSSIWLLGEPKWKLVNKRESIRKTATSLFTGEFTPDSILAPYTDSTGNYLPDLFILPASYHMIRLEDAILQNCNKKKLDNKYRPGDEYRFLAKYVDELRRDFDFIIIDCPPNLYNVTRNSLCHSDYVAIPSIPDTLSTLGLKLMIHEMEKVVAPLVQSKSLEKTSSVLGVIISKFQAALKDQQAGIITIKAVISGFQKAGGLLVSKRTKVFEDQPVRAYTVHSEAVQNCKPLCLYKPNHPAYSDIKALTAVLLEAMEG
jgi:chromosome partitioning protein